jgi:hypothetical protein
MRGEGEMIHQTVHEGSWGGKKGAREGHRSSSPKLLPGQCGAIERVGLVVEEPLHCYGRSTITHELKENTGCQSHLIKKKIFSKWTYFFSF